MIFNKLFSQVNLVPDHFYIYSKSEKDSITFNYEYGRYGAIKQKLIINQRFEEFEVFLDSANTSTYNGVVFYIHGFQADNKQFEEITSKYLHDEIFINLTHKYNLIYSLKWTAPIDYEKSVDIATRKGRAFMHQIDSIIKTLSLKNKEFKVSFICHSMGNRIFEGISKELLDNKQNWPIDKLFMFAPDVEANVFETTMKHIPAMSKNIYIFHNIDDRTLAMAKFMRPHPRLGIVGPENKDKLPAQVKVFNTTGLKDNKGVGAQFTLHRYFYTSETIRNQMLQLLLED